MMEDIMKMNEIMAIIISLMMMMVMMMMTDYYRQSSIKGDIRNINIDIDKITQNIRLSRYK